MFSLFFLNKFMSADKNWIYSFDKRTEKKANWRCYEIKKKWWKSDSKLNQLTFAVIKRKYIFLCSLWFCYCSFIYISDNFICSFFFVLSEDTSTTWTFQCFLWAFCRCRNSKGYLWAGFYRSIYFVIFLF